MKKALTASTIFFIYVVLLVTGLLQAIVNGYINKFLGNSAWKFPPDFVRGIFQTFLHVNIPYVTVQIADVLTVSVTMFLGILIVPEAEKPWQIRYTDELPACPFARTVKRWKEAELSDIAVVEESGA